MITRERVWGVHDWAKGLFAVVLGASFPGLQWHGVSWTVAVVIIGSIAVGGMLVRFTLFVTGAVREWIAERRAMS